MKRRAPDYATPWLLLFGSAGLICTSVWAVVTIPPWVWLCVLGLAAGRSPLADRLRARRFDASERRKNRESREEMQRAKLDAQRDLAEMARDIRRFRARLAKLPLTELAVLVADHNAMVQDMAEVKRVLAELTQEQERQRLAGLVGGEPR